ncbi:MAG: sulfate/thiosulfate transport system permease protein [Actinomycetota bacterium]|nr:sulfate/thiosulfate transport system permease protein [Actinomycetota bacterium]
MSEQGLVLEAPRAPRPWASPGEWWGGKWGLRGLALFYLGIMVALPLAAVVSRGLSGGLSAFADAITAPVALEALKLTIGLAIATTIINAFFGTLLAYVLVRYRFPGRNIFSALVDLPFAIPTLVTGVMLVALYGPNSPVGGFLKDHGIQIAFAWPGILLALLFVTLPFIVRTVQPVLLEMDWAEEEASYVLGANGWTTFWKVILPHLRAAITGGSLLAFARALSEFGAIVIIAGNLTGKTLTAPVYIFQLTSQFKYDEAAAVSTLLFGLSFVLVLITERLLNRTGAEVL